MTSISRVSSVMDISNLSEENLSEISVETTGLQETNTYERSEKKAGSLLNKVQFVCSILFVLLAAIFTISSACGLIVGLPIVAGVCVGVAMLCIGLVFISSQIYFNGKMKVEKRQKKIADLAEEQLSLQIKIDRQELMISDFKIALREAVDQMNKFSNFTNSPEE